MELDDHFNTS